MLSVPTLICATIGQVQPEQAQVHPAWVRRYRIGTHHVEALLGALRGLRAGRAEHRAVGCQHRRGTEVQGRMNLPFLAFGVRRREDALNHFLDFGVRVGRGRGEAEREREVVRANEHPI